ncbi:hypothetical protein OD350_26370 [Clostridium beijerinckii]|uniref:nucleotidyltransferase domain-containing protein n=1 Tax=Clostridium TaxID=1485 RepID=UPI000B3F93C8|nr:MULTISPECIES: hypothetical protein [Clostridium]NOW07499.1 putative nucleotidyltransferase [Clostridium beijerinckii]NYC04728.1 putative nucleotidyltransferase [Clostridium beijerinckii]OVE67253.1 hypothetical protein CCS79_14085 [Clostridium diolis]UYZ35669.1 hypothetical protein OD350_26370 [Clostridium beijerinckii]
MSVLDENINKKILQNIGIDDSIVYLAGSTVEGFGNKKSDIDVYVICDRIREKFHDKSNTKGVVCYEDNSIVHNIIIGGVRYDFEYWERQDVVDIINRLNKIDFLSESYIEQLKDDEFDLIHRLKYGQPIINNEKFKQLYNSINFENLGFSKAASLSTIYDGYLEDVEGMLMSNDLGSAFFAVRQLVDIAVNSYLAIKGETNPGKKWTYRKLNRYKQTSGDNNLLEEYIDLQTRSYNEQLIRNYVKECMKFSSDLNIRTQNILNKKQNN